MRIDLLFPPPWSLCSVIYLALPTLTAYLRRHGVQVVQRDVNLKVCQHLLRPERILDATRRIADTLARGVTDAGEPLPGRYLNQARVVLGLSDYVCEHLEPAIRDLKGDTEDPVVIERSYSVLAHACRILSLPYFPSSWTFDKYAHREPVATDLERVLDGVFEDASNVFLDTFRTAIVPDLQAGGSRTFGLCLAFSDQIIPCLTLARAIKEREPGATIVLGGPLIPYVADAFRHTPRAWDLIDFIVTGEGERPLLALLAELDGERRFERVPSLTYREPGGTYVETPQAPPIVPAESPLADYSDYDLSEYWMGSPSLPYLSARGCYWNKCAFCSINSTYGSVVRAKPISTVVDELRTLHEQHHCSLFELQDEAVGPARFRQLATALLSAKLELYWFALARIEKAFSPELLELAYRGGCRAISWGFESGSQRVLDRMIKHTRRDEARRVLRQSHEAGIWNNIFVIIGYPGESEDDYQETLAFVEEASEWIHSLVFGRFRLEKCTPLFSRPEAFGVRIKPYAPTYCRADYAYDDLSEHATDTMARYMRFARFSQAHPGTHYLSLTLGRLLARLAAGGSGRERLRDQQRGRAERQRVVHEVLQAPERWTVGAPAGRIDWRELGARDREAGRDGLHLGLDPQTGRVLVVGAQMADVLKDPAALRAELMRLRTEPDTARFLGVAQTALTALPFSLAPLADSGEVRPCA